MKKTKISCFRYRKYNDIYVSNVSFSSDSLLSILDSLPSDNIIFLIESDVSYLKTLSYVVKELLSKEVMFRFSSSCFTMICNKELLIRFVKLVNIENCDGMFIANVKNDVISDKFFNSIIHEATYMVKNLMSDISISINFPENQMIISLSKEKYEIMSIKDRINHIFGT